MTDNNHPITPSPETVAKIRRDALHKSDGQLDYVLRLIHEAYRTGADQELEACCKALDDIWDQEDVVTLNGFLRGLRSARRPKPPSLKEQALEALDQADEGLSESEWQQRSDTIRRALESLPD